MENNMPATELLRKRIREIKAAADNNNIFESMLDPDLDPDVAALHFIKHPADSPPFGKTVMIPKIYTDIRTEMKMDMHINF